MPGIGPSPRSAVDGASARAVSTNLLRVLALASYVSLVLLVMSWIVFLGDTEPQYISLWLILFVTPLLIPLRGVLATRDKAMIWGALIALPYMVHGGVVAWEGGETAWLGVVETALGLFYLVSASFFIRWRAEGRP